MDDLVAAAVAYVRIKTLVEGNETGYSPVIVRELVKEYKTQQTKLRNILRLSKVNILTAESYQRAGNVETFGSQGIFSIEGVEESGIFALTENRYSKTYVLSSSTLSKK